MHEQYDKIKKIKTTTIPSEITNNIDIFNIKNKHFNKK